MSQTAHDSAAHINFTKVHSPYPFPHENMILTVSDSSKSILFFISACSFIHIQRFANISTKGSLVPLVRPQGKWSGTKKKKKQ